MSLTFGIPWVKLVTIRAVKEGNFHILFGGVLRYENLVTNKIRNYEFKITIPYEGEYQILVNRNWDENEQASVK